MMSHSSRIRPVYAWDGSGVPPNVLFSNPEPQDVSVTETVIKSVLWGEILDPSSDIFGR